MKIYLAGKIAANDWRHRFVSGLSGACSDLYESTDDWPILHNAIAGRHDYVGPFFVGCDHGCYHGPNTHGYGYGCAGFVFEEYSHCPETDTRDYVVRQCRAAMSKADFVFAWIEDLTAFGTIFELGWASADAHKIFLAINEDLEQCDDLWFIKHAIDMSAASVALFYPDIDSAFDQFLTYRANPAQKKVDAREKMQSPIEIKFYDAISEYRPEIEPQWQISANGHNYRADFALPTEKVAFELDGHEYHKTKEQRTNDARRERDLQKEGWKVIRFTGTEIHNNIDRCLSDALKLVGGDQ